MVMRRPVISRPIPGEKILVPAEVKCGALPGEKLVTAYPREVRIPPGRDRIEDIQAVPGRANYELMQCNKTAALR